MYVAYFDQRLFIVLLLFVLWYYLAIGCFIIKLANWLINIFGCKFTHLKMENAAD